MKFERKLFLGLPVDSVTMEDTLSTIIEGIKNGENIQQMAINSALILRMVEDPEMVETLKQCDIINADGIGIVWASRLTGLNLPERVAGIDLMDQLIHLAAKEGLRPFFFGAQQEIVEGTVEHYRRILPELKIAGFRNGYYSEEEEQEIAEEIRDSKADMLFVAISSPKKELFLGRWRETMNVPYSMGVGGSFDVMAGKFKRAPQWVQDAGLEWAYRWKQEPRRMFRRNMVDMPKFVAMVAANRFLGLEVPSARKQ